MWCDYFYFYLFIIEVETKIIAIKNKISFFLTPLTSLTFFYRRRVIENIIKNMNSVSVLIPIFLLISNLFFNYFSLLCGALLLNTLNTHKNTLNPYNQKKHFCNLLQLKAPDESLSTAGSNISENKEKAVTPLATQPLLTLRTVEEMGWNKKQVKNKHLASGAKDGALHSISAEFIEWFVGFTDAEGNFTFAIRRDKATNDIKSCQFFFQIGLHIDDLEALYIIKNKLGCGSISKKRENPKIVNYFVTDQLSLSNVIIPIFNKFKLNSSKNSQFEIWK
jgi:LAGLIDADG endonuclease